MKTALTIAGSDSSGGAGIQADIKTMAANGVYAMSAITALTAQNTTGVSDIMEVTPKFLGEQIDSVFTDIRPGAVKIGMVASAQLISKIAEKLKEYDAKNVLMPLADLLTPNIPEAEVLADMKIGSEAEMEAAAGIISRKYGCAVLCKGGHKVSDASDLLCTDSQRIWFRGERIDNPNTHGTGCTLSSAIASNLAKGFSMENSIERAKAYITGALSVRLDLGQGSGPMDHTFDIKSAFTEEAAE